MSDDEHFRTTLAYTKSPKTSKRTSFQDELQKAVSARISRQRVVNEDEYSDYSDEFEESDDDDILKNVIKKKATNERLKKTFSKDFLLSDDEEEKPQKVSFLKSKKLVDSNAGHEWERNHNENKAPDIQERAPGGGEQKSVFFSGHQQQNKLILHDEGDAKPVPIPKPRDYKRKSSPTAEGIVLSASDESFKPTPQQRSVLKRSNHADDTRTDEKSSSSRSSPSSLSAPSSLTRLNEKVSENSALVENLNPEDHRVNSAPPLTAKSKPGRLSPAEDKLSPNEDSPRVSKLALNPEGTFKIMKENGHHDTSQAKDSGRKSPSVLELMMATVYEQSKQQLIENPHLESNDSEVQIPIQRKQKVEQDYLDYSEQEARQIKSEQHRQKAIFERNLKNKEEPTDRVNSPSSTRSLNTSQSTKKSSAAKSAYNAAKSRYLGTLTILDNKQLLKNPSDREAADALRAAVYQDWLEKKRIFLQELQKIKKTEEEKEREKRRMEGGAKKEEASASFQAWKAVKTKELKKNMIKLKEEEEKKRKELEYMAEKKEESKKAAFEKWREDKEEHLKEKVRVKKQAELAKKRKEEHIVAEKKKDSKLAFSKWAQSKEDVLKSKKKEKLQEKEKQDREKAEKEWQEKKAMEVYERWLDKKERRDKIVKKQKKLQVILEDEPIPPWSPPGRTVPMGK